jgi:hypothetical protein
LKEAPRGTRSAPPRPQTSWRGSREGTVRCAIEAQLADRSIHLFLFRGSATFQSSALIRGDTASGRRSARR